MSSSFLLFVYAANIMTQVKINWFLVAILLIANLCLVESKRGFSIGRSRKKVSNPNVRRKTLGETPVHPSAPEHSPTNQKPIGWNVDNKAAQSPVGPPPAYPGLGHNSAPPHGAPPAYSPSHVNPPSYSAATGNSYSNIGRIPPRGSPQSGPYPDATSFHGIGYGHNAYGGPSHTSGLYANNGMGMGGYSGLGTYGSGYGHGGSSPFSFGNILTGLAVWNIARGFNSYNRPQHVYIHDNREVNNQKPIEPTSDVTPQITGEVVGPVVSPNDCVTCSELPAPSTESPVDAQENYVTYHPSLLTYARGIGYQADSVHYFVEKTDSEANNVPESTTFYEQKSTEFSTELSTEFSTETYVEASTETET